MFSVRDTVPGKRSVRKWIGFHPRRNGAPGDRRPSAIPPFVAAIPLAFALLTWVAFPARVAAQFPGELRGHVVSATTGAPVSAALIDLPNLGRTALTDGTGTFHLRGLEPGLHEIVVRRIGFTTWTGEIEVFNGRVTTPRISLETAPITLSGVDVVADAGVGPGATAGLATTRFGRDEIQRQGARTVGDVVRRIPGATVREDGPGGAQTISIRGSDPDAVLVLLDGVPINDPVTGVADLSAVPAGTIESVTVLAGALGARYGARAQAGVVLVETRAPGAGAEVWSTLGSLGEWGVGGEAGASVGRAFALSAGGATRRVSGEFDFRRVPGVDETIVRRVNADVTELGGFLAGRAPFAGGEIRLRAGAETLERGIPGRGYAPSREARQELERARGTFGWRRSGERMTGTLSLAAVQQRARYRDPSPPISLPYDDVTRARSWEARGEIGRIGEGSLVGLAGDAESGTGPTVRRPSLRAHGLGVEILRQRVDATSLADGEPRARTDFGGFAHAALGTAIGSWDAELSFQGRVDRGAFDHGPDGGSTTEPRTGADTDRWFVNRAVSARLTSESVTLHVSNRSGYSPPSLGDQFFREGVAVAPNPELRAERIPSEWEAGASVTGRVPGALDAAAGVRAFRGDIRGMIIWLPDFRFVWSPRNADVKRRGVESWAEVTHPGLGLGLNVSWAVAAVTLDRPGTDDDDAQVAYRPRHTGLVTARWERGSWRSEIAASFTGTRYPAAAEVNPLDPFWTLAISAGREWSLGGFAIDTAVHVDRLLDEKDSLIFGFPEAGRRIRIEARLRPAGSLSPTGESW